MFKIKYFIVNFASIFLLLFIIKSGEAQIGSSGSMSIKEGGSVTIFGQHNFLTGSGLIQQGIIKTARKGEKGYLNFAKGSSWAGADEENYIDGYVRVFDDQPFVLPIGQNGIYRPILVEGGKNTSAAYYANRPPNSLESSNFDKEVSSISSSEYWDIQGDQPISISLYWDEASKVSELASGDLNHLRIVGLKQGKWRTINSSIDNTETKLVPTGNTSNVKNGVLSSKEKIIPNDYEYFTLGITPTTADSRSNLDKSLVQIYPNPVRSELFVNLEKVKGKKGHIQIYNLYGQLITEETYDPSANTLRFDTKEYLNGMYEVRVRIDQKEAAYKFTVQRLY